MKQSDDQQLLIVNANYEIFVLLITLLSIVNSVIIIFSNDPAARSVIQIIEYAICVFLLADFFHRLIRAPRKRTYLIGTYGWLDLLGSLPLPFIRVLRLARPLIITRKLRHSDFLYIQKVLIERRAQSTLLLVMFLAVVIFEVSGMAILRAESQSPQANIQTASDALWWAYVTVATVGYGDRYPVTNSGRIVGIFVMTAGVGLFSVVTSYLADWFRRPRPRLVGRLPTGGLEEIYRLLDEHEAHHQQTMSELRARLVEIEKDLGK
jgi:voltage-gated potassium channel